MSARKSAIPDVRAPGLRVLFCGINPGRVSAAARAHFANPRNDFWRLLHAAGFTPRLLDPAEQRELLAYGAGITNAAWRTTRGSGALRKADFDGAAERLGRVAAELRPEWIAFVGKRAYSGTFAEDPDLGLQSRRLADTRLFVLPSTSPANAAVPWKERLRWFQELAGRATGCPLRRAVRALVLDPDDRVLLVRFQWPDKSLWAPPGGGLESGESEAEAIARELAEECGLRGFRLGPRIWTREHWFADLAGWGGQAETIFLVRTDGPFAPAPECTAEQLAAEGVVEQRWWTQEELRASVETFAPRRLAELTRQLVQDGPPREPLAIGI